MCICNASNSTLIARLIHAFLPVKTRLLIACHTTFYAMIMIVVYRFYCLALFHSQMGYNGLINLFGLFALFTWH